MLVRVAPSRWYTSYRWRKIERRKDNKFFVEFSFFVWNARRRNRGYIERNIVHKRERRYNGDRDVRTLVQSY